MTTDLDRREKPCPTCGGSGEIRGKTRNGSRFVDRCYECGGRKVVPAESPDEYAARLRALVEQARKERDWLRCLHAYHYARAMRAGETSNGRQSGGREGWGEWLR